ncbi:MAG: hypothetical protein OXB88_03755 [Bacteriovoracales bacterium]|nr:hypothetical protein [Bacteriovoracales bacterium]
MRIFIFIFLSLVGPNAFGQTDEEKRKIIESVAKSFDGKKIFYRWQSKKAGDNLLAAGEFTDELYDYFMGMDLNADHFAAGQGLYVSDNPYDSAIFIRGNDKGSLIQVEVDEKLKYISLSDPETLAVFDKFQIDRGDITRLKSRIAVKYHDTWWVIKGQEGVRFTPFTVKHLKAHEILKAYAMLAQESPKGEKIFKDSLDMEFSKKPFDQARFEKLQEEVLDILRLDKDLHAHLTRDSWIFKILSQIDSQDIDPHQLARAIVVTGFEDILKSDLSDGQVKRIADFSIGRIRKKRLYDKQAFDKRFKNIQTVDGFLTKMKMDRVDWSIPEKLSTLMRDNLMDSFLRLNPSLTQIEEAGRIIGDPDKFKIRLVERELKKAKRAEDFLAFLESYLKAQSPKKSLAFFGKGMVDLFLDLDPSEQQMKHLEKATGTFVDVQRRSFERKLARAKSVDEFLSTLKSNIGSSVEYISAHNVKQIMTMNPSDKQYEKLVKIVLKGHNGHIVSGIRLLERVERLDRFLLILSSMSSWQKKLIASDDVFTRDKGLVRAKANAFAEAPLSPRQKLALQRELRRFGIDIKLKGMPKIKSLGGMIRCLKKNLRALP